MSFRCWIVADFAMVRNLIADGSPLQEKMDLLDSTTGHFRDVGDWQWGEEIPSRRGKDFLNQMLVAGGGQAMGAGSFRVSNMILQQAEFPVAEVAAVFAVISQAPFNAYWLDVVNYETFLKIPAADIDNEVPAYMPSRLDDESNALTWRQWGAQSDGADPTSQGGFFYIVPSWRIGFGLCGSVISQLVAGGFTLLTRDEYLAEVGGE